VYLLLAILSFVDWAFTARLHCCGGLQEVNPIANFVLSKTGIIGLSVYKAVLISLVCSICSYLDLLGKAKISKRIMIFANVFYSVAALYHLFLVF
jgi:hypothetical protein